MIPTPSSVGSTPLRRVCQASAANAGVKSAKSVHVRMNTPLYTPFVSAAVA